MNIQSVNANQSQAFGMNRYMPGVAKAATREGNEALKARNLNTAIEELVNKLRNKRPEASENQLRTIATEMLTKPKKRARGADYSMDTPRVAGAGVQKREKTPKLDVMA